MSRTSSPRRRGARRAPVEAPEITTYPAALRFLGDRMDLERTRVTRVDGARAFRLDRMKALMEAWGNPQEQVRMVHVAGTVGKGSTVAMIASLLEGCGYAVGQYTSPHLVDLRERVVINGQMIGRSEFVDTLRQAAEIARSIDIDPTFFELMTAVAFRHFAEQAVDLAVIETGLGGRLDATNVIVPEASVITRIDFDHQHLLGSTLAEIAGEKAGIMKRGVPAITFEQDEAVLEVLARRAEEIGAPLRVVGRDLEFSRRYNAGASDGPQSHVCLITETSQFMHLPVPLPGEHQAMNCGLALAVADLLKGVGFACPEIPMLEGLARTRVPGRMELIWSQPRILVDGAHNAASMEAFVRSVGSFVAYDSMVCIFGCCEDKDVDAMLDQASRGGDKIIFTKARGNPRAIDPIELQRRFGERSGKMSQVAPTIAEALDLASRAVGRDDLVCIVGSFYLVGDAKKHLADLERRRDARPSKGRQAAS